MKMAKRIFLAFVLAVNTTVIQAQETGDPDKFMRSRGLSYVVVAVMLTILIGLILYLVRLERKIRKLEKQNQ